MLKSKKILIGICGGIAGYKVLTLIRLLKKANADVKVIITPTASNFVGKVSLAALSGHPVWDQFAEEKTGLWNNHVELGLWADLFLIAPLTANTLSKMASGQADNLLLATFLSARCPVVVAPAMDLDMWTHSSTQRNLKIIQSDGVQVIDPTSGSLASGLEGKGRMEEPEKLYDFVQAFFNQPQDMAGKKVLVNLGPTQEPLDPVRFISNHSSGKMGAAICQELKRRGAKVYAIVGPVSDQLVIEADSIVRIQTAEEMHQRCIEIFPQMDMAILSAAVADYTPKIVATSKIKKMGESIEIELIKTVDIAAKLGGIKSKKQFLMGFALETNNELEFAKEKLSKKNLDAIVLNSMKDPGAGFGHSTNKISILNGEGQVFSFETKTKKEVAKDIVDYVVQNYKTV